MEICEQGHESVDGYLLESCSKVDKDGDGTMTTYVWLPTQVKIKRISIDTAKTTM